MKSMVGRQHAVDKKPLRAVAKLWQLASPAKHQEDFDGGLIIFRAAILSRHSSNLIMVAGLSLAAGIAQIFAEQ
jgi:hypothetical protein